MERIQSGGWLADSEVSAVQCLLRNQFPLVDGLQDATVLAAGHAVPCTSQFVQILNAGTHWVCMSNIQASERNTVDVYDSMFATTSQLLEETACRMIMSRNNTIKFVNQKVQRQVGGNDCGLFAIAFATSICFGKDPSIQSYNQPEMRSHLLQCLEHGEMSPFPSTSKAVARHKHKRTKTVKIFCSCRMPANGSYTQCHGCQEWFHATCENIPHGGKVACTWQCK